MTNNKYNFSPFERYAVYTVHREKCYLNNEPLDLKTMQVDHIIPESLLEAPERLADVLMALGRPADFQINSYYNWMPACGPCNNTKSDTVFKPSPLVQTVLERAAEKADAAAQLSAESVSHRKVSNALNTLERASEAGEFNDQIVATLEPLITFHVAKRAQEDRSEPVRLTPLYQAFSEQNGIRIVRGPYGVGVGDGPINPNPQGGFGCPTCGFSAWNGARCVICGEMSDD